MTETMPTVLRDIVPRVGSIWIWEPLKPHARQKARVTAVRWNGEEVWVEAANERGQLTWNELSHWVESTVLLHTAAEAQGGEGNHD